MQFLFDHAMATAVGLGLILILLGITVRQNNESVEISNHRAVSGRTASLTLMVRRDFESLSAVQAVSDTAFAFSVTTNVTTLQTRTIEYRKRARPNGMFQVLRLENGVTLPLGAPVTAWSVSLLTDAGAPTAVLADARQIRVRAEMPPAFVSPSSASAPSAPPLDAVWEHTFAPTLLGVRSF